MRIRITLVVFFLSLSTSLWAQDNEDQNAAIYFESVKFNHQKLYEFLDQMPKVVDSHKHMPIPISLTDEFLHAAIHHNLSYSTIKNMIRNSLTYSVLPGKQLWLDQDYSFMVPACAQDSPAQGKSNLSDLCQAYLDKNIKASLQWQLEERFAKFEEQYLF